MRQFPRAAVRGSGLFCGKLRKWFKEPERKLCLAPSHSSATALPDFHGATVTALPTVAQYLGHLLAHKSLCLSVEHK